MKLWNRFYFTLQIALGILWINLHPAVAGNRVPLSPGEFKEIEVLLCDPDTVDQLKTLQRSCDSGAFTVWLEDLDGDGRPERLIFGPSGVCGAHGNCPFAILKQSEGRWQPLMKTPCTGKDCLGWANDYASQVLTSRHRGYRDLLIAADAGSFYWTKSAYFWDGQHYRQKPGGTTYFLVDGNTRLKAVSKARWEQCSREGKNCLQ